MQRKKRFLILTSDSGFGHRSAANSIAKALKQQHEEEAYISVINPIFEQSASNFLQKAELNYDRNVTNYPVMYRFAYEISDTRSASSLVEGTLSLAMHKNLQRLIDEMHPDVITSTNQMYGGPVGTLLHSMKSRPPFFTVVTDLADVHSMWFNSKTDRFYVASDLVKFKAIASGISPDKIIISGIPVDPCFAEIQPNEKRAIRIKLGLDPDLTTLLVVGSRRVRGIPDCLAALEMIQQPFQLVVVAGGDGEMYEQLIGRSWKFPIHILNFVTNIPEYMASADILVTKAGGLILSEGLAAGLPVILVDFLPGQEEGNVRFLLDHQAGALTESPWKFFCTVDEWLKDDQAMLKTVAANSRKAGHPDSALVIADAIWQSAELNITQQITNSKYAVLP